VRLLRFNLACSALILALASSSDGSAQERKIDCESVPKAVLAAFAQAFPKAAVRGCATEIEAGKTAFEITSKEGEIGRDALYDADGTVMVVEETMAVTDMPDLVQQAVQTKFPRGVIARSEKVMSGGTVLYEFRVRHRGKIAEAQFDPGGHEVPKKP
jgi:hypothetical protein